MQEEVTRKTAVGTSVPPLALPRPCRDPAAIPTPAGVPPDPSPPASPAAHRGPPDPGAPSLCRPPLEAGSGGRGAGGHCAQGPPGGRGPASPTGACTHSARPASGRVPAGLQGPCEWTYCPAASPSLTLRWQRGGVTAHTRPPVALVTGPACVLMRMLPTWGPAQV